MIYSILDRSAGFFSMLFFTINHYLHSKKYNISFKVISDSWLFKYKYGWEDYFYNIDISIDNDNTEIQCFKHCNTLDDFTLYDYKNAINEIYKFNDTIIKKIDETVVKLQLEYKKYDAIFIRRGDKLTWESKYIPVEKYMDTLLKKNPDCKTIFLQTDDYNCYLELINYINNKKLKINIITLCKEHLIGGMIIFDQNKNFVENAINSNSDNKDYIIQVIDNIKQSKSINTMNNDEIYEHTIEMLIGIHIVLQSNICICEYSSNVSKFIKLAHKNCQNVLDVLSPDLDIDMNRTEIPAGGFLRDESEYLSNLSKL